jgi:hypothetical protein
VLSVHVLEYTTQSAGLHHAFAGSLVACSGMLHRHVHAVFLRDPAAGCSVRVQYTLCRAHAHVQYTMCTAHVCSTHRVLTCSTAGVLMRNSGCITFQVPFDPAHESEKRFR